VPPVKRRLRKLARPACAFLLLSAAATVSPVHATAAHFTLTWADNSNNEDSFKIERKVGTAAEYTQIAVVGPNSTSYVDTGLAASTTYCYRVRADNSAGDSPYSNEACGTTGSTPTVTLSVTTTGAGSGTVTSNSAGISCGSDCAESMPSGTTVSLRAAPAAGWVFGGWSGGGCAGTGDCAVTLLADTIVAATFAPLPGHFALSVTKTGSGLGSVTGTPGGIRCGTKCAEVYLGGTVITLWPAGHRGSLFGGWNGGGCAETTPCSVALNADTTVSTVFTAPPDRPVIFVPPDDDAPLMAGTDATFAWTPVPGASQYGFEFSGANRAFSNPGGTAFDGVNGFQGSGGGLLVGGTTLPITIPADAPPGAYQVRVVGLTADRALVGRFSEAVTVLLGALPGGPPAFTSPGDGSVILRGSSVAFAWTAVEGAAQYLFKVTGPDPDGPAGTFLLPGTGVTAVVPTDVPPGPYRIRILGLTAGGVPIGQFSAPLTVVLQ
jgi:Divergent InlB B-repeat domain